MAKGPGSHCGRQSVLGEQSPVLSRSVWKGGDVGLSPPRTHLLYDPGKGLCFSFSSIFNKMGALKHAILI